MPPLLNDPSVSLKSLFEWKAHESKLWGTMCLLLLRGTMWHLMLRAQKFIMCLLYQRHNFKGVRGCFCPGLVLPYSCKAPQIRGKRRVPLERLRWRTPAAELQAELQLQAVLQLAFRSGVRLGSRWRRQEVRENRVLCWNSISSTPEWRCTWNRVAVVKGSFYRNPEFLS